MCILQVCVCACVCVCVCVTILLAAAVVAAVKLVVFFQAKGRISGVCVCVCVGVPSSPHVSRADPVQELHADQRVHVLRAAAAERACLFRRPRGPVPLTQE